MARLRAPRFHQTTELSQEVGVGVPLGLDVLLGPGRVFVELQLLYRRIITAVDRPGFGSMTAAAGYRFVF